MMFAAVLFLAAAHPSLQNLVSSNGYGTLQFSIGQKRFDRMMQHPYKFESANNPSRDLLFDAYYGVKHAGGHGWTPDGTLTLAEWVPGTGIIRVKQTVAGAQVTTYAFTPRTLAGTAFVMIAKLETATPLTAASLYAVVNQRLSVERPEPSPVGESIRYNLVKNGFEEYGPLNSAAVGVGRALGATRRSSGGGGAPTNPWQQLTNNQQLSDAINDAGSITPYNADDIAFGYQWEFGDIPANGSGMAAVMVSYDHGNIAEDAWGRLDDWLAGETSPQALLDREIAAWSDVTGVTLPAVMPEAEQALYKQSLAVLKMSQIQESGRAKGQILASPAASTSAEYNQWNITWVRDMAYATTALAEAGQFAEARAALEFQLRAQVGRFAAVEFIGRPYQISACRYFGDGSEESDDNENGPNVEYDGFGLFLWSLGRYVALSGDKSLLDAYWPEIKTRIADVLVALIEPYSGLIRADSSIWETHWNGKQKQFTYTTLTAISGLCAMGKLADTMGELDAGRAYRNTARQMRQSAAERLIDSGNVLASSLEERTAGKAYYDAAVLEAGAMKIFDPKGEIARATNAAMLEKLSLGAGRGLYRNDEGGDYDNQEWVFVDTRAIISLLASGRAEDVAKAETIYTWIVEQSAQNANAIAELYNRDTADYQGSVPMAGFGAGAFILAAHQKYAMRSVDIACGAYDNTLETALSGPGATTAMSEGEMPDGEQKAKAGCSQALPGAFPLLLLGYLLYWLLLRDRRREK